MLKLADTLNDDLRQAIARALSPLGLAQDGPGGIQVLDGNANIDLDGARQALDRGATVAVVGARAGQLAGLHPGCGCDVPCDAALFAVKRAEIDGRPGQTHTTVTFVPAPGSVGQKANRIGDDGARVSLDQAAQPPVSPAQIAEYLHRHLTQETAFDDSLIPPPGVPFGSMTYSIPWSGPLTQSGWTTNNGATQTWSCWTVLNFYVYYANGASSPYYVVLLVANGSVIPAVGGVSGMCCYVGGEKAFALGTYTPSYTPTQGALTLIKLSPSATTSPSVETSIDYSIPVLTVVNGQHVLTEFELTFDTSVGNPDWGVGLAGNPSANQASWQYYNITGWNASIEVPANFGTWWESMYDSNSNVIDLDAQALNGGSFTNAAVWTIPPNPGNQGPLNAGMRYENVSLFEGFANPSATGNGHHQLMAIAGDWCFISPQWDLVQITNSASGGIKS